jgi:hypothetical protein
VLSHLVRSEIIRRSARSTYLHTGRPQAPIRLPGFHIVAPNLSDKGDTRPGPAHLVGPHFARGPARLLTALDPTSGDSLCPLEQALKLIALGTGQRGRARGHSRWENRFPAGAARGHHVVSNEKSFLCSPPSIERRETTF